MNKYLGIDFGTTNSVCAVSENGKPTVLKIENGDQKEILKSVLYVSPKHKIVIGKQAIDKYLWDVKNLPATPPKRIATGRIFRIIKSATSAGGFAGMEKLTPVVADTYFNLLNQFLETVPTRVPKSLIKNTPSKTY